MWALENSCNFLELKYISGMHSQTLKRQAEDVIFNSGMYLVLSENNINWQKIILEFFSLCII